MLVHNEHFPLLPSPQLKIPTHSLTQSSPDLHLDAPYAVLHLNAGQEETLNSAPLVAGLHGRCHVGGHDGGGLEDVCEDEGAQVGVLAHRV